MELRKKKRKSLCASLTEIAPYSNYSCSFSAHSNQLDSGEKGHILVLTQEVQVPSEVHPWPSATTATFGQTTTNCTSAVSGCRCS